MSARFHLDAHDFPGRQIKAPDMPVIGAIGERQIRIELAVRDSQPAFRHRHRQALLASFHDFAAVGSKVTQGEK